MRLTTADIHPTDVKSIEALVNSMARQDKSLTLKKYTRWCVIEMTNQLLKGIAQEQEEKAKLKAAEVANGNEGTAEPETSVLTETNQGEGVSS